jgi:integrase
MPGSRATTRTSYGTGGCSLWLAHGFETVFVKQWSGHSKASMLSDVYGHVVTDPASDEWRAFWLEAATSHGNREP